MDGGGLMVTRLIDSSIMLNLLDVPKCNDERDKVISKFQEYLEKGDQFILPIATIIETGNDIVNKTQGNKRRIIAERFADWLKKTSENIAPWSCESSEISNEDLEYYAENYVSFATRRVGMGDLSIVRTFEKCVQKLPFRDVMIWSIDGDLGNYSHQAELPSRR